MPARRQTLRVPELRRGLHDFVEESERGHAQECLNITFQNGAPATRLGIAHKLNVIVNQRHHPKGLWHYRTSAGNSFYLLAYVIRYGGGNDGEARLVVMNPSGVLLQTLTFNDDGGDPVVFNNDNYEKWGGVSWMNAGSDVCEFIIGSSNLMQPPGDMFTSHLFRVRPDAGGGDLTLKSLDIVDRHDGTNAVDPFWGGELADTGQDDDFGPYMTLAFDIGGPVMAVFNGRLATSILSTQFNANNRFSVRVSNTGDIRGWPMNGYASTDSRDPSPVTGLAVWDSRLVVFTRDTMTLVSYDGPHIQSHNTQFRGHGCVAHATVKRIIKSGQNWIFWLSANGVYAWAGGPEPRYVSRPIEKRLRARRPTDFASSWAFHHMEANEYWLVFPNNGIPGVSNIAYVYNYKYDAWSEYDFGAGSGTTAWPVGAASDPEGKSGPFIMADPAGAYTALRTYGLNGILYGDEIADTAQTTYKVRWESHPVNFGHNQVKRWRYCRPTLSMQGDNQTRAVYWVLDNQSRGDSNDKGQNTTVPGFPPGADVGGLFGVVVFGQDTIGAPREFSTRVDMFGGPSKTVKFGVETTQAGRPFQLLSLEFDVIERGVRR